MVSNKNESWRKENFFVSINFFFVWCGAGMIFHTSETLAKFQEGIFCRGCKLAKDLLKKFKKNILKNSAIFTTEQTYNKTIYLENNCRLELQEEKKIDKNGLQNSETLGRQKPVEV